jgi:YD repeat-containing protein
MMHWGRVKVFQGADGSPTTTFYDDGSRPSSSDGAPGSTVLIRDAWGRERWSRSDALGQLAEVVEPDANGNGKVTDPNNVATHYAYDTLGHLVRIVQGSDQQERVFAYDSLGRLTAEKLPEKSSTLSSTGICVGTNGTCSDVFTYDDRSNLTSHTDARGIKTVYDYGDDPLNRLQGIRYDMSGFKDTEHVVTPAAPSTFKYMPDGDVTRLFRVETKLGGWQVVEEYGYDAEGRLSSRAVTFPTRPSLIVSYDYDTLSRLAHLTYPIENGTASTARKIAYSYGTGGRITDLMLDGMELASQLQYNAADQITSLATGVVGPHRVWETYGYDPGDGLLSDQQVVDAGSKLLDLTYGYRPSGASWTTGQLTGLTDNLHSEKNRTFDYDALGRLKQASGGNLHPYQWTELYRYDSYGNRTSVQGSGNSADGSQIPTDGARDLSYELQTNHVNSTGFKYDAAGNQTDVIRAAGSLEYRYDAANRLSVVLDGAGNVLEVYGYSADNRRLMRLSASQSSAPTFYVWDGTRMLAEYTQLFDSLIWSKGFVFLSSRLLATTTRSCVYYHHPDHLGNRLITNDQDSTVIEQVMLPFGTVIDKESSGTFNPILPRTIEVVRPDWITRSTGHTTMKSDSLNQTLQSLPRLIS